MAKSMVKTTVEVYSPKDCKFRIETAIKFAVEKTIQVDSPMDWKFKVETTEKVKIFFH